MTHRVIQWSTGNVGAHTLRSIVLHPELELAGLWVHSPDKVGRDAADLCGLDRARPASSPPTTPTRCSRPTPTSSVTPRPVTSGRRRRSTTCAGSCAAGKHVVATSVVSLLYPPFAPSGWVRQLTAACEAGGTACFTSGIDPGFANDLLPLVVTGFSERIDTIRIVENLDYSTYMQPEVLFDTMGFGQALDAHAAAPAPGRARVRVGWRRCT